MNFVPCVTWVKRGIAKAVPDKVQLSKEELKKLIEESITDIKELRMDNDDDNNDTEKSLDTAGASGVQEMEEETAGEEDDGDDLVSKYNLESYDKENSGPGLSVAHLADLSTDKKNLQKTENEEVDSEIDSDDEDDFRIRPQDNLIVAGHVTEDCSVLEVYVYNEMDDDLYVHHDIILPAFPISLEWINYGTNDDTSSNYLAIGDMTPVINIWDLDMVDIIEPIAKLGRKLKKKEKEKKRSSGEHGHSDAVLDLSWNKHLGHALASGSADNSVILWDLTTTEPVTHLRHHTEKVQCVEWHPFEAEILLTGSCDKHATLYDARSLVEKKTWNFNEEVERLVWNHFDPFCFLAGTDQGNIYCIDVRQNEPLFCIDAHNKGISDLTLSSSCPGLLVSTGSFTSVKIWDITKNQPKLVESKKLKEGNLLACRSSPDSPLIVAVGGDKPSSNFRVLNLSKFEAVTKHFAPEDPDSRSPAPQAQGLGFESAQASSSLSVEATESRENPTFGTKVLKKKTMSKKKWK